MNQTALFDTRHGAASGRTTYAPKGGQDARNEAYHRLTVTEVSERQRQYLELMQYAANGHVTNRAGRVLYSLTDAEASAWLEKRTGTPYPRSSVNGRRNELCGNGQNGKPFAAQPLIERKERRACFVTGQSAVAWGVTEAGKRAFVVRVSAPEVAA